MKTAFDHIYRSPSETYRKKAEDISYARLIKHVTNAVNTLPIGTKLFRTVPPPGGLYSHFLAYLPRNRRQHYECRSCKQFMNTYGGLVTIQQDGSRKSVFFDKTVCDDDIFSTSVNLLVDRIQTANILDAFGTTEKVWGHAASITPKSNTGKFHHFQAIPREGLYQTPERAAAIKERRNILTRALIDYPEKVAQVAVDLIKNGSFSRAEKHAGLVEWFLQVHKEADTLARGPAWLGDSHNCDAVLWRAAANAPEGFCNIRSTVVGTLLEDIKNGWNIEAVRKRYEAKVDPIKYQRPIAPPTTGQIDQAEKLFKELNLAKSLERRYTHVSEIVPYALWKQPPEDSYNNPMGNRGGIFSHLRRDSVAPMGGAPSQTMTWHRFRKDILPQVVALDFFVPAYQTSFFAFVTAAHADAPPILQWDRRGPGEYANPVNWYMYYGGSRGQRWALKEASYAKVQLIVPQPNMWGPKPVEHFGDGAYFILEGARDTDNTRSGLALFPEEMRSELHGVRAVIEAASKTGRIASILGQPACGFAYQRTTNVERGSASGRPEINLRVTTASGMQQTYHIDRWE